MLAWGEKLIVDGICTYTKSMQWLVRSVRHVWTISRAATAAGNRAIGAAWTRVNNCTRETFAELAEKLQRGGGRVCQAAEFEFWGPVNWPAIQESEKS